MKVQSAAETRSFFPPVRSEGQAPPQAPQDRVERARPSLMKRVFITSLGGGSVGGAAGFALDLVRGQGLGGPAWATGVTVGLAAGAVVGLATYLVSQKAES